MNASHNGAVRVVVDKVRLYFDVEGCGLAAQGDAMVQRSALVLLHGGPGADHSFFKPEFSAMADAAQVIYLDQRGSGRSDRGDPSGWTWSRWAEDVAGFCDALEIASPVLVGTSSGGRVAVECAARHPGLAGGLVLDSTLFEAGLDESLEVFGRRGARRPSKQRSACWGATAVLKHWRPGRHTPCPCTGAKLTAIWPRAEPGPW